MLTFTEWHNYYLSDHLTTSNYMNCHQCEGGRQRERKKRQKKKPQVLADCFVVKSCMDKQYCQSILLSVNHFMKLQKPTFILSGKSHSCYIYNL